MKRLLLALLTVIVQSMLFTVFMLLLGAMITIGFEGTCLAVIGYFILAIVVQAVSHARRPCHDRITNV